MKSILLLIYVFSYAVTSCAFSTISIKSSVRTDIFLRAANNYDDNHEVDEVDIAIIGAGIGGLCAGAILNTLYNKKVGIYESHYLPGKYLCGCISYAQILYTHIMCMQLMWYKGGCAHAFDRKAKVGDEIVNFTFDSGPTIVLGERI